MKASDCMTKNVRLGDPDMSIFEAARIMKEGDFGVLPIAKNDRLVGMLTDRDIAIRAVAEGKDPRQVHAGEVMSKGVLYCFDDQDVEEITKNFGENQIRRLPVLNRQKRLVGILSLGQVAQSDADPKKVGDALCDISSNKK